MREKNNGVIVRVRRQELGMTMREFAEAYNLSPALVCQIEKGNIKTPTMRIISALAEALELPIATVYDLFGADSNKEEGSLTIKQKICMLLAKYGINDNGIDNIMDFIEFTRNKCKEKEVKVN